MGNSKELTIKLLALIKKVEDLTALVKFRKNDSFFIEKRRQKEVNKYQVGEDGE